MFYGDFIAIDHFGTRSKIKTCYKKQSFPPYFYDMACGTFTQFITAPSTIMTLDINGNYVPFQVYKLLKEITNNQPFTASFIQELNSRLDGQKFLITQSYKILDLREIFLKAMGRFPLN